jgi:hypothetical protein
MRRRSELILVLAILSLCLTPRVWAQAVFGSIYGTVTDPSGAVVAGAKVTTTEVNKGITVATTTNESGNYTQPHLVVGAYKVSIEASGFKTTVQENVPVSVDASTRVDVVLQVGEVTQEVTVSAAPSLLKTDRADVSTTLTSREVTQLPVLNRNFTQLELLLPGTSKMNWQHASSENPQGGIQINTNGQLFGMNNFMIDGADNNDPVLGIIMVNPNLDSVQEFKMTSGNYDAEFAQAGGSVIQVDTKSGTNEIHGSAFEFLQNNVFKARNPFSEGLHEPGTPEPENRGVPPLRWNQFGGAIGGPLIKNKLFGFGDYQGTRRRTGASVLTRVPTAAERTGDFSAFGIPIFDPATGAADGSGRTQFSDPSRATPANPLGLNIIPQNRITSQAANLLNKLPLPNLNETSPFVPNYAIGGSEQFDSDQFDIRIDHYLTERFHYFGRYSYASFLKISPAAFGEAGGPSLSGLGFAGKSDVLNQNGVLGFNYTLSPTLLTDFRFAATRYRVRVLPLDFGVPAAEQAGLPGLNLPGRDDTSGLPELKILGNGGFTEGFGLDNDQCNCPLTQTENVFQWVNNWTKVRGNHTIKWGTDIRRAQNVRIPSDIHRAGQITFTESVTGSLGVTGSGLAPAAFLLGLPNSFKRFVQNATNQQDLQTRMFYFAQDSWRVTSKLNVSFGLRWDTWFPNTSKNPGQGSRYDASDNLNRIAGIGGNSASGGMETQWHNFSPRLAVAYNITPKTVIRTGWGRSFFQGIFGWTFNNTSFGYPTLIQQALPPTSPYASVFSLAVGPPLPVFPEIPSNGLLPLPDGISTDNTPKDLKYPYVDAWNLSVERQVATNVTVEASYVGNVGRHLNSGWQLNSAFPGPGDFNPRRALWQKFGISQGIFNKCDCSSSSYNALQAKVTKRFSNNFSLLANYTWSKALDFGEFGTPTNQFNTKDDYGPADFDRASVFNIGHEYILPFGPGQRWLSNAHGVLRHLVEGWQWTGITTFLSGYPFSPTLNNNSSLNADMSLRPDIIGDPSVSNPSRNGWFNPAAFAVPAPYKFGNASRNSLRGPGVAVANWSLFKNFRLTEALNMQFRWEVFNTFNRTNLGAPSTGVDGGSAAGQIFNIDANEPMRNMQFALRFTW